MSDHLEVSVCNQELEHLNDDLGYPWPQEGMACPVAKCGNTVYTDFMDLRAHWKLAHQARVLKHLCMYCSWKHVRKNQLTRHYRRVHKLSGESATTATAQSVTKTMSNGQYIDPGVSRLPNEPQERRDRREAYKGKVRAQRYADIPTEPVGEQLWRSIHINRDQVVEVNDEGESADLLDKATGKFLKSIGSNGYDSSDDELDLCV